jgi:hypothetical protein
MRRRATVLWGLLLAGCNSTVATVTPCNVQRDPHQPSAAIEVVQDPAVCGGYQVLGHIRAGGNGRAWEAMERVKAEAQRLGADAITNVHRVTGSEEAIYEADAIQWLSR